jgi:hypothetical protein
MTRVSLLTWAGDFSLLHTVLTLGAMGSFPRDSQGMKLTTLLHLVPKPRMMELYLHFPAMCLWAGHQMAVQSQYGSLNFILLRLVLGPTHPPIQRVSGVFPQE